MDDETWGDPGVAALVERVAVPLRVDADARPDLYGRYHLGGLPTTALLDSEGAFIRGGTYLSPGELHRLLDRGLDDWRAGRRPEPRSMPDLPAPPSLVDDVIARILRRADPECGGFGVAPKLPETDAVTLLVRRWRITRDPELLRVARAALDAVVAHLCDRRDGGFFRYAAGADWTRPHTEKLALDQAQIARALLEAGAAFADARYVLAARSCLGHARRRLADRAGRIFASAAADPDYYERALASAAANPDSSEDTSVQAAAASDSSEHASPRVVAAADSSDVASDADGRMPAVDERRFADGGAAMVWAAAVARTVTGKDFGFRSEFREAAPSGCVVHRLDAPPNASGSDGDPGVRGLLRDQALAIAATLAEYRLCGDRSLLGWCARAADWTIEHLWDERASAFRAEPATDAGVANLPPIFPLLANGEMAFALCDLADHTGESSYRERAGRVVRALGGRAARSPAGTALALAAQHLDDKPPARPTSTAIPPVL